ncbi:sulfatase-like hydrolase/transferase, partial [Lactococcus lactis]
FDNSASNMSPWGIKDKLLFRDSVPLLEQMQQPFYVKYLTVTNHLTYTMDDEDKDPNFATVDSGNKLVDGYFETAHYLDQAVQQFYDYLKKSGLYDKSIIVLYGDHYGISGSDNKAFAPYVGYNADTFNSYDSTM